MSKILVATMVALLALAGCNTMRGAGKDVSSAGDAMSNQAAETQSQM